MQRGEQVLHTIFSSHISHLNSSKVLQDGMVLRSEASSQVAKSFSV